MEKIPLLQSREESPTLSPAGVELTVLDSPLLEQGESLTLSPAGVELTVFPNILFPKKPSCLLKSKN